MWDDGVETLAEFVSEDAYSHGETVAKAEGWIKGLRVYRKLPVARQDGVTAHAGPHYSTAHLHPRPEPVVVETTATNTSTAPAKAKTNDDGKPPLAQLPWAALDAMAQIQLYGQKKYGDFHNYRKGMEVSRNLSCAMRHIRDYMNGHDVDHESGQNPLAHAAIRIAFVLQNLADGVAIDDRYKPSPKA